MLTQEQAGLVKGLLARGEKQHDVAAFFGENGGRIAEIKTGKRYPDIAPAAKKDLPSPSDVASGYAVYVARQAILRAQLGLSAALSCLDEAMAAREVRSKTDKRGPAS